MAWITAIVGVLGAGASADASSDASGDSKKASKQSMRFTAQQYKRWKGIYGGLEENLGRYYNNLTPDAYITKNLQEYNKEHQMSLDKVRASLAQRGISDSGMAGTVETMYGMQEASAKAQIRAEGEDKVREQKIKFLNAGLSDPAKANMSSALANNTAYLQGVAQNAQAMSSQAIANAVETTGTALSDYFNKPTPELPEDFAWTDNEWE